MAAETIGDVKRTYDAAREWKGRLESKGLSPRHIVLGIMDGPLGAAFGDRNTHEHIRTALINWERDSTTYDPSEMREFFDAANLRARLRPQEETGVVNKPNNLDLLHAALQPEGMSLAIDPLNFNSGDQAHPRLYKERVWIGAGGELRKPHYQTMQYKIAAIAEANAFGETQEQRQSQIKIVPELLYVELIEAEKIAS